MKKILFGLVVYLSTLVSVHSQTLKVNIESSIGLESLLTLNALANPADTTFSEDQKYWTKLIEERIDVKDAFDFWKGNGIGLSYLFSCFPGPRINDIIDLLEKKEDSFFHELEHRIAEQEYVEVFDKLKNNKESLLLYLKFLEQNNFSTYWREHHSVAVERAIVKTCEFADKLNVSDLQKSLSLFGIQADTATIYVTYYSGNYGYSLLNNGIGISVQSSGEFPYLFPHEICHQYTIPDSLKDYFEKLHQENAFYSEAYNRIYKDFKEGREEELVIAAGLYVSYRSGLLTKYQCLRKIKFAFADQKTLNMGAPVAGIIFNELLLRGDSALQKGYSGFVGQLIDEGLFSSELIQQNYYKSIQSISGIAGMKLIEENGNQIIVDKVYQNYPASNEGIRKGDRILSVDNKTPGNMDECLELLSGNKGDSKHLQISRDSQKMGKTIELQ